MTDAIKSSQPAHRPSRRNDIIDAAIRLFARKGFVDASISDVAEEADVVVTAVYYHFAGKEELFSSAVHRVFEMISAVVSGVRADDAPADEETLDAVTQAVWNWTDTHPDEATLVYRQLPGATPVVTMLRHEFEERHVKRAFAYFEQGTSTGAPSAALSAVETLRARTLVDLLVSVHTMRLADGPLSGEPSAKLLPAVRALIHRLVTLD